MDANNTTKIHAGDVQGFKYLRDLRPLFARLHEVGCASDKAGNRKLHFDQYCALVLLYMFSPTINSLRAIQQASRLGKVQRHSGCEATSLGSLSESVGDFEPQRLREIIDELAQQLQPVQNVRGGHLDHVLTAVDGSVIPTLTNIIEAAYLKDVHGNSKSAWRLHAQFDIERYVPTQIDLTSGRNGGKTSEKNVLRQNLQSDHCYVLDRGYAQFTLFNAINAIDSSYVCRLRDNCDYEILEERPLSEAAKAKGVFLDAIVRLGRSSKRDARPDHPIRLILIKTTPHVKRGGSSGPGSDGVLRLATNLLDVPAEILADIYQHRWSVEIFFRFLKGMLGCRHLLSHDPNGIQIQIYIAIIACMLLSLWTSRKPTRRTYEMFHHYLTGLASAEELQEHLERYRASSSPS